MNVFLNVRLFNEILFLMNEQHFSVGFFLFLFYYWCLAFSFQCLVFGVRI